MSASFYRSMPESAFTRNSYYFKDGAEIDSFVNSRYEELVEVMCQRGFWAYHEQRPLLAKKTLSMIAQYYRKPMSNRPNLLSITPIAERCLKTCANTINTTDKRLMSREIPSVAHCAARLVSYCMPAH